MSSLSPEKALIFRITHIANVPVGSSNPNVLSPNSFGVARPGLGQALPWIRTSVPELRPPGPVSPDGPHRALLRSAGSHEAEGAVRCAGCLGLSAPDNATLSRRGQHLTRRLQLVRPGRGPPSRAREHGSVHRRGR